MSKNLQITLAQVCPSNDLEINLRTAQHYLETASSEGSNLVVFPEMFMVTPSKETSLTKIVQEQGNYFTNELKKLAKYFSISVVCGIWDELPDENEKVANIALAVNSDGEEITRYRKIHLFDALGQQESDTMQAGAELPALFSLCGFSIGLGICYDLRFPELFRQQALAGAEIILIPAAWYEGPMKEEQWQTLLQARAIENTLYTVGVNFSGSPFAARSCCFDPFGEQIAELGKTETHSTITVNKERLSEIRARMPCLKHVRRDLY